MSLLLSTGLKNSMCVALKAVFDGGRIDVFSGPPPASPNLAPTGVRLGSVTTGGVLNEDPTAGLVFEASGQYLLKPNNQHWVLRIDNNGTAGWWRLISFGDDPDTVSLDTQRIDGVVGTGPEPSGAVSLWLPTTDMVAGVNFNLDYFMYTFPPTTD